MVWSSWHTNVCLITRDSWHRGLVRHKRTTFSMLNKSFRAFINNLDWFELSNIPETIRTQPKDVFYLHSEEIIS